MTGDTSSLSLSLAAKEMNKSAAFCLPGPLGGSPMEQTCRLCIAVNPIQDASISQDKQSRINKLRCVSMLLCCQCLLKMGEGGGNLHSRISSKKKNKTRGGGFWNWVKELKTFTKSDHFIKSNPVQHRKNLLPAFFCCQSTENRISVPLEGQECTETRHQTKKPIRAFKSHGII